jgi:hypothetical protein
VSYLTNPRAQTLAGRPRRRITFGQYDRAGGYPVVCDLSGTPAAVAELERALKALPAMADACRLADDAIDKLSGPFMVTDDIPKRARAAIRAALALLDAPEGADAPPVAAHAAVDGADDFGF